MAEGHYQSEDSDPRICIAMDQSVFDAINAYAAEVNESFSAVARELLRCAVEDGLLQDYFPKLSGRDGPSASAKRRGRAGGSSASATRRAPTRAEERASATQRAPADGPSEPENETGPSSNRVSLRAWAELSSLRPSKDQGSRAETQ